MAKTPETYRAFSLRPYLAVNPKTGEILNLETVKQQLVRDVYTLRDLVEWQLDSASTELLDIIDDFDQPAATAGRYMGLSLPEEVKTELFSGRSGISRFETIWRGTVVGILRSWKERLEVAKGTDTRGKFISKGFKRTARATKPTVSLTMNTGFAGSQYVKWIERGKLQIVIDGHWVELWFSIPKRYTGTMGSPTIVVKDGEPVFHFAERQAYQFGEMSADYVVGVDVGVARYASVSVVSKDGRIVQSTTLSERVHSLENSIRATAKQIGFLHKKLKHEKDPIERFAIEIEIEHQRRANSNKKRELAKIAAQEIADIAFAWGNAVVIVEDLSHISNTMRFGRWNRGELIHWLRHYLEQNGSRLFSWNAAYSSQICSRCQSRNRYFKQRVFVCKDCGLELDRDINAAANMAIRGLDTAAKAANTRRKSKRFTGKKPKKRSPEVHPTQKHPGSRRKFGPTPKRPPKAARVVNTVQSPRTAAPVAAMVVRDEPGTHRVRTLERRAESMTDSTDIRVDRVTRYRAIQGL